MSAPVFTVEPPTDASAPGPVAELVDVVVAQAKTGGDRGQCQKVENFADGGPAIDQPEDCKKRLSDRMVGAGRANGRPHGKRREAVAHPAGGVGCVLRRAAGRNRRVAGTGSER